MNFAFLPLRLWWSSDARSGQSSKLKCANARERTPQSCQLVQWSGDAELIWACDGRFEPFQNSPRPQHNHQNFHQIASHADWKHADYVIWPFWWTRSHTILKGRAANLISAYKRDDGSACYGDYTTWKLDFNRKSCGQQFTHSVQKHKST
jgi:hypothetical protein